MLEFQFNLLKFLVQKKESLQFFPYLDEQLFDREEDKVLFSLVNQYYSQYGKRPSQVNLLAYFEKFADKHELDKKFVSYLEGLIASLFDDLPEDMEFIQEEVINFSKRKLTRKIFETYAGEISGAEDKTFQKIYRGFTEVMHLGKASQFEGSFLFEDFELTRKMIPEGHPTFLSSLNSMTSAGGFHTPQLIVLLAGAKCFKTGIMLAIALEYVRSGLNVYYADFENGRDTLLTRSAQYLLQCGVQELLDKEDTYREIEGRIKKLGGGDLRVQEFRGKVDDLTAVEADLDRLEIKYNWKPDVIFYDYLDLADASDKSLKDRRLKIQHNYHHAININRERNTFCFTVSKVKSSAYKKEVLTEQDFAEDAEKVYNCHASFAICRTEEELDKGLARIIPIVQREGVSRRPDIYCALEIDEKRHVVKEILPDSVKDT